MSNPMLAPSGENLGLFGNMILDKKRKEAWDCLPQDAKHKLRCLAQGEGWTERRSYATIDNTALPLYNVLTDIFGTYWRLDGVPASEIMVGDIVRVKRDTPSALYNNMPYCAVNMPFCVEKIEQDCHNSVSDRCYLRNGSTCLNIHPTWLEKWDETSQSNTVIKIGDVVIVTSGKFAGERGVVVGIIAYDKDYDDPYYELAMDCEVPDKYKCRRPLLGHPNVAGGFSACDFVVIDR